MQVTVLNIIKQIIKSAKEGGISTLAKTRLIKLLYLVEIEYYKYNQKRLTDLKWQFYHYGPYTSEIESILGSPDIGEIPFVSRDGRLGNQYNLTEDEFKSHVNPEIKRLIDYVVKDWGETDLNKLLDYVYFETEPMKDAKRGDLLDFTKIKPWKPPEKIKNVRIDPKKFTALKEKYLSHIKKMSKRTQLSQVPDKSYFDCVKTWDDEISTTKLTGQVVVKFGEQRKDDS